MSLSWLSATIIFILSWRESVARVTFVPAAVGRRATWQVGKASISPFRWEEGTNNRFLAAWTRQNMAKWPSILNPLKRKRVDEKKAPGVIDILEKVGAGSYGTVHLCRFVDDKRDDDKHGDEPLMIAKRAWTAAELEEMTASAEAKLPSSLPSNGEVQYKTFKQRAKRCAHFLEVERYCFEKLQQFREEKKSERRKSQLPELLGVHPDGLGRNWLVFSLIERKGRAAEKGGLSRVAVNLSDAIHSDWRKQHNTQYGADHHLSIVQRELGLPEEATFEETLDVVFESLLTVVEEVHEGNIVHRDLKPSNLLCDPTTSSLVLIDFGSAADMDPVKKSLFSSMGIGKGERVGLDGSSVAISPIYAAPELFVKWDRAPLNFDTFSVALIFCQLLFNLLDDRTDAAFHQQLEDAQCDLDAWLARELSSTVRPSGLEDAMIYLGERPGMWRLLKDMFRPDPEQRVASKAALKRLKSILARKRDGEIQLEEDGSYFDSVLSAEVCEIPSGVGAYMEETDAISLEMTEGAMMKPRPLHFVATFDRHRPLGLVLSETDGENEFEEGEDVKKMWNVATSGSTLGEVFVRRVVPMGQADQMGIFEIGDRLQGVGDFPIAGGGFEKAVEMLSRQPESARTVKLHFDRRSVVHNKPAKKASPHRARVVDQGAWSSKGRRKAQEDAFVLHEIHDDRGAAVLVAGVFDGHGGTAASRTVSEVLPNYFAAEIADSSGMITSTELRSSLSSSWETTCATYRSKCDEDGTCVAEYDQRQGVIMAGTGSNDLVAGTTAVVAVLSVDKNGADELIILNCGDSRALVVGSPIGERSRPKGATSVVHFTTRDHSPSCPLEAERLQAGREQGLDYALPECSFSRWWLTVGDYQYALSRSLEGSFAYSKGIVSDADLETVSLKDFLSERNNGMLVLASDGIFEVMDNEEIGREMLTIRKSGFSASEAAKKLCGLALSKGTSDNVSVLVVYLD